ncbi:MAG: hypothetical protein JXB07_07980 [Anaerolineae bacterium]|nr:hypothetical protein [Anaerolineae bacterium]
MKQTRNYCVVVLLCLLTACAGAEAGTSTGEAPTMGANDPPLPTWTPAGPEAPASTVFAPYPDSVTTTELGTRLDPFGASECPLPCYNGLVPGQGGLQETLNFYSRLGISALDMMPGDYEGALDGTGNLGAVLTRSPDILQAVDAGFIPPRVDVRLTNNIVRYVHVKWEAMPSYLTIKRIIEVMGQPDRLELGLILRQTNPEFIIQMTYSSRQTGFAFFGAAPSDGSQLQVCLTPDQVKTALLGVYAPDEELMTGFTHEKYLLPLLDTLGLPYTDFVTQVNAGGCLVIPSSQWAAWQSSDN